MEKKSSRAWALESGMLPRTMRAKTRTAVTQKLITPEITPNGYLLTAAEWEIVKTASSCWSPATIDKELLPCHICGEKAKTNFGIEVGYSIKCKCGYNTGSFKSELSLIKSWNKRPKKEANSEIN